ncbi:MAG: TolC family outer membrane protein [Magnetococcales bacterium]|nr:TolC family outer membrane protein [Magnetococcales bacterium]
MKKSWRILLGGMVVFAPGWCWADDGGVFRALTERTLADNPRVRSAQSALEAARERLNQAWGGLLPEVGLGLSQGHARSDWQGGANGSEPRQVGLNLSQNVFNQSAIVALRQAQPYVGAYEKALEAEKQGVFLQVARVALNHLKAREVARLAHDNRAVTERNLEATRDRFRVGEITRTDVSQASSRLASAEADLLRAENAVAVGKAQFEEVVGQPPPPELLVPALEVPLLGESLEALIREAQQRPDLQAVQLRLRVSELNVEQERAGFYPVLGLTSSANRSWRQETPGRMDPVNQVTMTLALNVPLYSGGKTTSRVEQARAEHRGQEVEQDRLLRQIAREVEQAQLDYRSVQAVVRAYEAAEKAASEAKTGIEQEYRVGSRTALDLLVAQNVLFTSQTDLAKSRFDLILAQFQMLHAVGRLELKELSFTKKPSS